MDSNNSSRLWQLVHLMFENENARRKDLNSVEEGDMAEFRDILNLDRRTSQLFPGKWVWPLKLNIFNRRYMWTLARCISLSFLS